MRFPERYYASPDPRMSAPFRPIVLATGWTVLIIASLSIPGSSLPSSSLLQLDKFVHFALFFVLTGLWLAAKSEARIDRGLVILGLILVFAIGSEYYQEVMPIGRMAELRDALADSVGALLAFVAWIVARPFIHRSEK